MNRNKPFSKILAWLLTAVMIFGTLPIAAGAEDLPVGAVGEIIAFEPLADELSEQSVPLGTELSAITLPETLTATVQFTSPGAFTVTAVPHDEGCEDGCEEDHGELVTEGEPEILDMELDVPVTWTSAPDYAGETAGIYVFAATVGGGFSLSEVVTPSVITVTVCEEQHSLTVAEPLVLDMSPRVASVPTYTTDGWNGIFANGTPVVIQMDGGVTKMFLDDGNGVATGDALFGGMDVSNFFIFGGTWGIAYTGDSSITVESGALNCTVFGGSCGSGGTVNGNTNVTIKGGSVTYLYGGGDYGNVTGTTNVFIEGGTVSESVYGGGYVGWNDGDWGKVTGATNINVTNGTISGSIIGGGCNATVSGDTNITVEGGSLQYLYGGGDWGAVSGTANVTIEGGTFGGGVYGGGLGAEYGIVGNTSVEISGGTFDRSVFGGGLSGAVTGDTALTISGGTFLSAIFGGGEYSSVGNTRVAISGGEIRNSVIGGGGFSLDAHVSGNTSVTIGGTASVIDVYGGGAAGNVAGTATVLLKDNSSVLVSVYGGGNMAAGTAPTVGNTIVTLKDNASVGGSVYGGGYEGIVTGTATVNFESGSVTGRIYGGGFGGDGATAITGEYGSVTGAATVNMGGGATFNNSYEYEANISATGQKLSATVGAGSEIVFGEAIVTYMVDSAVYETKTVTINAVTFSDCKPDTSPTKTGNVFNGWHFDESSTDSADTTRKVIGNITLYAHWSADIALNISGTHTFANAEYSYSAQTPLSVTITNTGTDSGSVSNLEAALSGAGLGSFTITQPLSTTLATGGSTSFTVVPKTGLAVGTHTATVTVTGDNEISKTFDVSFTVNKKTLTVNVTVNDKIYDGTDTATINEASLEGVVGGDEVTLTNGTPTFSSVNVGNDIPINFTAFSISGAASDNYSLTQPTGIKANITAAPNATHTITFNANGGSATPSSMQTGTDGKLSSLPTPMRSGSYSFDGWFTAASGGTQITTSYVFTADTTIYAQWTYTGSTGGGGGGSTPMQTVPAASGAVQVNYTQSGGAVTLSLPTNKINEIIGKSTDTATIDLSGVSNATSAVLPKTALAEFADARLDVELKLPQGTVMLNSEAAASVAEQASGTNLSVQLNQAASSSLNAAQRDTINDGDVVFNVSIMSGTQNITAFDGNLTVTVPYSGELPVGVWYLNSAGELEKLECTYDSKTKTVSFTLTHLSLYVVGNDTSDGPAPAWVNPFNDVKESDWFYESVKFAHQNGLFSGTSATTFTPNGTMTRGMMVTVLWRLNGSLTASNAGFADVAAGQWYTEAVSWAYANGIVSGVGGNLFAPNDEITREQMAVMLNNYAKFINAELPKNRVGVFADDDKISSWAKEAVNAMYAAEILNGKGANGFDPQGKATRAEVAQMFKNFMRFVAGDN